MEQTIALEETKIQNGQAKKFGQKSENRTKGTSHHSDEN